MYHSYGLPSLIHNSYSLIKNKRQKSGKQKKQHILLYTSSTRRWRSGMRQERSGMSQVLRNNYKEEART